jgi:RimJ/RimL family protein N-acetyltransferase
LAIGLLEGKNVCLKVLEKEDLLLFAEWSNNPEFGGEYESLEQSSYTEVEKWLNELRPEEKWFLIEKRDGSKIGQVLCLPKGPHYSIGYRIVPDERNKGYCTEAVEIIVDYLFLSKDIVRIESESRPKNTASIRVLEKAGFVREGLIRKSVFIRGEWKDGALYSILREEWKDPKILTKTSSRK